MTLRWLLAAAGLTGCFAEEGLEGRPCRSDAGCGSDDSLTCVDGFCRPQGFDPRANCDDGEYAPAEYCFDRADLREVVFPGGMNYATQEADFDGDGDLDVMVASGEGLVSFQNLPTEEGVFMDGVTIDAVVPSEEFSDLFDVLLPGGSELELDIGAFGVGDLIGGERPDLVVQVRADVMAEVPQAAQESVRRRLLVVENVDGTGELEVHGVLNTERPGDTIIGGPRDPSAGLRWGRRQRCLRDRVGGHRGERADRRPSVRR